MSGAGWLLVAETRLDSVSEEDDDELVSETSDVEVETEVSSVDVWLVVLVLLVERIESELVWLSETCLSETDDSDDDRDKETDSLVLKDVECDSLALIELDSLALNEADSLALIDEE